MTVSEENVRQSVGVVIIGRNEGQRLINCLDSIFSMCEKIVYVDSGSTDDSVNQAEVKNSAVVNLDMSRPFTAARARNAGFSHLLENYPDLEFVQFIDGDCVVSSDWLPIALEHLILNPSVAVVCGRRLEKFPDRSVYNMLCDIEWNTPIGANSTCGGDALIRTSVLKDLDGYNPLMIAGEEPELCYRIRRAGWGIDRIDCDMTWHDADITKFSQWWNRNVRSGHAFAESSFMYSNMKDQNWTNISKKIWMWGAIFPGGILVLGIFWPLFWILYIIYPVQIVRLRRQNKRLGDRSFWYAFFLVLCKFPEMIGQVTFFWRKLIGKTGKIIEYK